MSSRRVKITNDEGYTAANVQLAIRLHAGNWDFSNSQADGSDVRLSVPGNTNVAHWNSWGKTNSIATIVAKIASVPPGVMYLDISGGNASDASLSSYNNTMQRTPADAACIACIDFHEGAGTNLASTVGNWPSGVANVTFTAGDGGAFGSDAVAARFTGGFHGAFDGVAQVSFIPDLLTTAPGTAGTISFWLQNNGTVPNTGTILAANRFGLLGMAVTYSSSNRLQVNFYSGTGCQLNDLPLTIGDSTHATTNRHHIAITYGSNGAHLWINGNLNDRVPSFTTGPLTIGQQFSSGTAAGGMSIGGQYDPRPGFSSAFAKCKLDTVAVHSSQFGKTQIDQLRQRVGVHQITTGFDRLHPGYQGSALATANIGAAFNDGALQEPNIFHDGTQFVCFVRAGISSIAAQPHGCRIVRCVSSTGTSFASGTAVLGMGAGASGFTNSATCPFPFKDPVSGNYHLYFSIGTTNQMFTTLACATSTDGVTFPNPPVGVLTGGFTNSAFTGNMWVGYKDGTYHLELEAQSAGAWQSTHFTGTTPTNFTQVGTTNIAGLGFSFDQESSGPFVTTLSTGENLTILHCEAPSRVYARRGYGFDAAPWGLYDVLLTIDTGHNAVRTDQYADPTVLTQAGTTYFLLDDLGANAGGIASYTYAGTLEAMIQESIRAEVVPTAAQSTGATTSNERFPQIYRGVRQLARRGAL